MAKSFAYNGGVKQGCNLVPSLFGIYAAVLLLIAFKDIKRDILLYSIQYNFPKTWSQNQREEDGSYVYRSKL